MRVGGEKDTVLKISVKARALQETRLFLTVLVLSIIFKEVRLCGGGEYMSNAKLETQTDKTECRGNLPQVIRTTPDDQGTQPVATYSSKRFRQREKRATREVGGRRCSMDNAGRDGDVGETMQERRALLGYRGRDFGLVGDPL